MPEGDTIHRTATRLGSALTGRPLATFDLRHPSPGSALEGPTAGETITEVRAEGKYLVIAFAGGAVLETHMKMTGAWHLYRPGERWRRSRSKMRVLVATDDWVAVCFAAPHVRLYNGEGPGGRRRAATGDRAHLGPDLCTPDPDLDEIRRRLAAPGEGPRPLLDVLLDQRLFCGVGNVYKCEVLWACGHHPLTPLAAVDRAGVDDLIATSHRLLRANLDSAQRTTVPEGLAVYGRAEEPCLRCDAPIAYALLGRANRPTYWCPGCQPEPAPADV
ncbi:MAG: DNA-formamidopyrimidine glycosylase family protein [Actinomycetota bacterium]